MANSTSGASAMHGPTDELVEREAELRAIADVLAPSTPAPHAVAVISGPAGIGKTRLLDALTLRAGEDGRYLVLGARAAELETDLAWGVVRQLFAPVARDLARPAARAKSTFSAAVSSSIRWKAWNTKPTA
jgi:predicted ATPase